MRLSPQQKRLVDQLRAAGPAGVHMREIHWCFNYTARFSELRKKGFKIRPVHVQGSEFRYVLDYEPPDEEQAPATAAPTKPDGQSELLEIQRWGDSVLAKPKVIYAT